MLPKLTVTAVEQDAVLHASSLIRSQRYPPWSANSTSSLAEKAVYR